MRRHARYVLPAAFLLLAGCGASGGSSGSGGSGSSTKAASSSGKTTTSGSSSASLPDPCTVVTPAMVKENFRVTVTAGKPEADYMGGRHCVLSSADGDNTFDVFTSPEPDKFIADETYAGSDPLKLTAPGVTRGGAALPAAVYVVKGKVGVVVQIVTADQEKDPDDQGVAFGNELAANF